MSGYRKIFMPDLTVHHTVDGLLHREDGPALITPDGREEWYQYGVLHREDGPALIDREEEREQWYQNGILHRIGGPAVTDLECQLYYQHGKLHREDGPAEICGDHEAYWLNDRKVDEKTVMKDSRKYRSKILKDAFGNGLPLKKELHIPQRKLVFKKPVTPP